MRESREGRGRFTLFISIILLPLIGSVSDMQRKNDKGKEEKEEIREGASTVDLLLIPFSVSGRHAAKKRGERGKKKKKRNGGGG